MSILIPRLRTCHSPANIRHITPLARYYSKIAPSRRNNGNFRAVIVGAGPVGLTAAHAFSRAGLDYVVLEGRDTILDDVGASLVLEPQTIRAMSQIGLLDKLQEIGCELWNAKSYTADGRPIKDFTEVLSLIRKNHGSAPTCFHRADLVKTIYGELDSINKSRILTNKRVAEIEADDGGVQVRCKDGSQYEGDIVVGADGVHSVTRQAMRRLALEADPGANVNEEMPYVSEYKATWFTYPRQPSTVPGQCGDCHDNKRSTQFLTNAERSWTFLFERLPTPTRERGYFTEKDCLAQAEKFADMPVTATFKVKDVFPQRYSVGMAHLEEGICKHWHSGRIALVGDACHKFTPNRGLGFNNGIQDVVSLTNELRGVILRAPGSPSTEDLSAAFQRYQDSRRESNLGDFKISASMTRMCAWPTTTHEFLDKYVVPNIPGLNAIFMKYAGRLTAKSHVFDYLPGKEPLEGEIPWLNRIPVAGPK